MDEQLIASARWERIVGWCYPPSWRGDGRSTDMIVTALTQAEAEQRDSLDLYEVVDLAVFGLWMRAEQLGRVVPRSARFLMAWVGLLGGVVLGLTVLTVPARFDPAGYSSFPGSWYADLSAAWLLLAGVVVVARPRVIRFLVCGVLGLSLGAALFGGSQPRWIGGPVTAQTDGLLAYLSQPGPAVFVVLPLAALACFCLDSTVLADTARWLRIALVGGAVVTGLIFGLLPRGYLFVSAPPSLPPIARAVLVVLGCGFVIALVVAPWGAPSMLLMAIPWLLPADVTIQNLYGEHRLLPLVLVVPAAVLVTAVAANVWRLRSRMIARMA